LTKSKRDEPLLLTSSKKDRSSLLITWRRENPYPLFAFGKSEEKRFLFSLFDKISISFCRKELKAK
jgi:hypothetical protein